MQKMQMASTISSTTKPGMPASRASGSQGGVELLGVGGGGLDGGGETEAARVMFGISYGQLYRRAVRSPRYAN